MDAGRGPCIAAIRHGVAPVLRGTSRSAPAFTRSATASAAPFCAATDKKCKEAVAVVPVAEERVRLRGRLRGIVDSERLDAVEDFRVRDAVLRRMKGLAQARFGSNPSRF